MIKISDIWGDIITMKIKSFYHEKFAEKLHPSHRLEKVISVRKNYHFNRLLDVGCGDGSFSALLKGFKNEVYGVDISEKARARALLNSDFNSFYSVS